jgi:hypothetical protein
MTGPSAARLEDLYDKYAIKFDLDWNMDGNSATSDEPTDENLKAVLDHCVRRARPGEFAAIRRHVLANRATAEEETTS